MTSCPIRIDVETAFLEDQSEPTSDRYVFAYTITIRNEGRVAARLLSRHWVITDSNGKVQEVRGDGVLGERLPTAFEQRVPLAAGDCVILWSDGLPDLATHSLQASVSLRSADEIARRFLADSAKPYDDAGCVVMKWLK